MNSFYSQPVKPSDILHYGVKGKSGRYPWGSGGRPYQRLEKPRGGIIGFLRSRKEKKAEQTAEALEKEKESRKAEKERVIKEGSATEVLAFNKDLTNEERQRAITRLNLEAQLNSLSAREKAEAMNAIDNAFKTIRKGTEWARIGIEANNLIADIYNNTEEGKKNPWPVIGKKSDKNKDSKKD